MKKFNSLCPPSQEVIVAYEYNLVNQIQLGSGRQNIEYITLTQPKSYMLIRREVTAAPYAITVDSPDCVFNLKIDGNTYEKISYKQVTIVDSTTAVFMLSVSIDSYKVEVKEDNYCNVYITGGSNKDGVVVNEGVLTQLTLSSQLPNYQYVFPFFLTWKVLLISMFKSTKITQRECN